MQWHYFQYGHTINSYPVIKLWIFYKTQMHLIASSVFGIMAPFHEF